MAVKAVEMTPHLLRNNFKPPFFYVSRKFQNDPPASSYPLAILPVSSPDNEVMIFYKEGLIEKVTLGPSINGDKLFFSRTGYSRNITGEDEELVNVRSLDGDEFYFTTSAVETVGTEEIKVFRVYKINKNLVEPFYRARDEFYRETLDVEPSMNSEFPIKLIQWNTSSKSSRLLNARFNNNFLDYDLESSVDLGVKAYDLESQTINSVDYDFIANGTAGLRIIGSNGVNTLLKTGGICTKVCYDPVSKKVFVCEEDSGVSRIDVSDPAHPVFLGRFDSPGTAMHFLPLPDPTATPTPLVTPIQQIVVTPCPSGIGVLSDFEWGYIILDKDSVLPPPVCEARSGCIYTCEEGKQVHDVEVEITAEGDFTFYVSSTGSNNGDRVDISDEALESVWEKVCDHEGKSATTFSGQKELSRKGNTLHWRIVSGGLNKTPMKIYQLNIWINTEDQPEPAGSGI